MKLKNFADDTELLLPDDLLWTDEHGWTPAVASVSYLLTGALLVESATRQAGRPITLAAPTDMAWVTRATVNTLYAWVADPKVRFELTLRDARRFTVAFRHQDGAMSAEPVAGFPVWQDADRYRVTLRLMEVREV